VHHSPRRLLSSPCALASSVACVSPFRFVFVASARAYSAVCFPLALRLRSLPHLSCIFILFSFPSIAPALRSFVRYFPSSPCAPQRSALFVFRFPTTYVSVESPGALVRPVFRIARLPLSRDANHWSRALAASSWVAQDTHTLTYHIHTHPVANY